MTFRFNNDPSNVVLGRNCETALSSIWRGGGRGGPTDDFNLPFPFAIFPLGLPDVFVSSSSPFNARRVFLVARAPAIKVGFAAGGA